MFSFVGRRFPAKYEIFLALPAKKKEKKKGKQKKENKEIIKPKTMKEGGGGGKTGSQKEKNCAGHPIGAQPLRG